MSKPYVYLLVAVAAYLAHASALQGGFVWLDHAHIEKGEALVRNHDWIEPFKHGFAGTGFYRPLMSLSLSIDDAMGGGEAWFYHVSSLIWHASAAVVVVLAAEAFGLSAMASAFAGLLFGVHPLGSVVAGAIAFRSEAMLLVFLLAVVIGHKRLWPGLAALALLLASLTKETGLVLAPLFILACEWQSRTKRHQEEDNAKATAIAKLLRPLRKKLLFAEGATWLVACALRFKFAPSWRATMPQLSLSEAFATRLAALSKSAYALLAIGDRTLCDGFAKISTLSLAVVAGLAALFTIAYLAWKRSGPALFLLLSLLPSLQLIPIMRWWSPHYLYLALAFGAMLLAEATLRFGRRGMVICGAVAIAYAAMSFHDGKRFQSDNTLWRAEVARRPYCLEGQFYLGESMRKTFRFDAASTYYELALKDWPLYLTYVDRVAALQNLGTIRLEQRRFVEAHSLFSTALRTTHDPKRAREIRHNLAISAFELGNLEEVLQLTDQEAERDDAWRDSLLLRAKALYKQGRIREAINLLKRVKQGLPDH